MAAPVKDDLHQLIHSLEKAEKRYFKIYAEQNTRKGNNNFITLFNAIDKQSDYNEAAIRKKFKDKSFIGHLSTLKYQLFQLILRSLREYNQGKTVDFQLREILNNIEILDKKGLTQQCSKLIQKGKNIAEKYEKNLTLLELSEWESRYFFLDNAKNLKEEVTALLNKKKVILYQFRNRTEFAHLDHYLLALTKIQPRARTPAEKALFDGIINEPLLKGVESAVGFSAKVHFRTIRGNYYTVVGDYQNAYSEYNELITLWEQNEHQIKDRPQQYRKALGHFVGACLLSNQQEKFLESVQKVRSLYTDKGKKDIRSISRTYTQELLYYLNFGEYEKGMRLVAEIEEWLPKHEAKIPPSRLLNFFYNISVFFFLYADYRNSLQWFNRILNHQKGEQRQDIQDVARIYQLIIHYELGNQDLIEYLTRSTYRYLRTREKIHDFEAEIMDFIRQSARLKTPSEFRKAFATLLERLENIHKNLKGRSPLGLQETIFWLESRVGRISLRQLFNEKLKAREKELNKQKEQKTV